MSSGNAKKDIDQILKRMNTNHPTCQWSKLAVPADQVHTMPTLSTKRTGCFADVNCLLAYLEHHKPRNYKQKIELLRESLVDIDSIHRAQPGAWSLYDPRRVKCERLMGGGGSKRKRDTGGELLMSSQHKKYKVEITDLDRNRSITHYTDHWKSFVQQAGYSLNHPMPSVYDRDHSFLLYPELIADAKSIKATPCEVRVTVTQ